MALMHFNMATYTAPDGDPGCNANNWAVKASTSPGLTNDPSTFNPAKLDVDNWV